MNANLKTQQGLLNHLLRTTNTMEQDSLAALGMLFETAESDQVKHLFEHHADETREQIANLERVFSILELEVAAEPNHVTSGIEKQATSLIEATDKQLHDEVALMSALGNEHFEISQYQALILTAQACELDEVVSLFTQNLEQEMHTSEELQKALKKMLAA